MSAYGTNVPAVFMVVHSSAASVGQVEPEYASIVSVIIDHATCDDELVVEDFNLLAAAEASPLGHIESHCCGGPSWVPSVLLLGLARGHADDCGWAVSRQLNFRSSPGWVSICPGLFSTSPW